MISPENQYLRVLQSAEQAVHRAYAPYSGVHVGAAVQDSTGKQFLGANIENASYGLTCCAERVALFSALMDGVHPYSGGQGGDLANRQVKAIAVASNRFTPTTPCGACRLPLPPSFIHRLGDRRQEVLNNPAFAGLDFGLHRQTGSNDLVAASYSAPVHCRDTDSR